MYNNFKLWPRVYNVQNILFWSSIQWFPLVFKDFFVVVNTYPYHQDIFLPFLSLKELGFEPCELNVSYLFRYYYLSGGGCVHGHTMNKALEKLAEFLDKKRQAGEENQNNGLILLCKNQDYLAPLLNLLSPDLTLNTIKGFGLLDSVCKISEIQVSTSCPHNL